jgi:putative transcriptional regulator
MNCKLKPKYKLKAKRVENGIKLGDMAKHLAITPQYLCKLEKGEVSPRLDLMKRISEYLETSILDLFF